MNTTLSKYLAVKVYSFVSVSALIRFIIFVVLASIMVNKFGWEQNMFSPNAGQDAPFFLIQLFVLYLLRVVINMVWHSIFYNFISGMSTEVQFGNFSPATRSSIINTLRERARYCSYEDAGAIFDQIIAFFFGRNGDAKQ